MATVFERIRKVTVEQLGVKEEEVNPSSSFVEDLGADSLDLVELIMALEEEFTTPARKITIPDEDAEKIGTVQDAMDYLKELGVSDQEAPKVAEKPAPKLNLPKPQFHRPAQPAQGQAQPQTGGNRPAGGSGQQQRPPRPQGQQAGRQGQSRQGQGGGGQRPQGQRPQRPPQGGQKPPQQGGGKPVSPPPAPPTPPPAT